MFNVQIINCMQYSEPDVITQRFALIEKKLLVPNEEERKQGNKKEKLTESLHLTVKIARRSNYNIGLRNLAETKSLPKPQRGSKWKNLPILHNNSSFAVQFSILVSKTRTVLLFTIKIIEMFELHARMPGMRSAEIVHNYT